MAAVTPPASTKVSHLRICDKLEEEVERAERWEEKKKKNRESGEKR